MAKKLFHIQTNQISKLVYLSSQRKVNQKTLKEKDRDSKMCPFEHKVLKLAFLKSSAKSNLIVQASLWWDQLTH